MSRLRVVCLFLAAVLLVALPASFADGDKEKRYQVAAASEGVTLFPPGHAFHDPTTAGLLRDDCTAIGWATFRAVGAARVSYIGGAKLEQSHCLQLDPPTVGFPTGFFTGGEGTLTGAETDKDGVRDTMTFTYQAHLLDGVAAGPPPWCNPAVSACPFTANGLVTITGGTGNFSQVTGGESIAFIVGSVDGHAVVYYDGTIESNGPLPGSY